MKTVTKVIVWLSVIAVWIVSMCVFVHYDLDTVQLPDEKANQFFDTAHNFNIEYYMADYFEDVVSVRETLENVSYRCLSAEESYDILVKKGNNQVDGFTIESHRVYISYTYRFDKGMVSSVTFFTLEKKNYVLFTLHWQNERKLSFMDISYVIYETDEFPDAVTTHFKTSGRTIAEPASYATIESFIQSGLVTLAYGIIVFVIYIIITTVVYRNKKKGRKLSDDETTTDGDIKKYIMNKLGKEFFDEEKVFSMPCLTVDAYGEKAKELICLIAENCNAEEIFIGGFFEKKSFIDEECDNTVFIKEYLDENSYSSINTTENEAVIEWIIDGNNKGETAVSFYIQELNILIYPAKNKLYIFSKNSNELYYKLATFINPTDYNLRF